MKWLSSSVSNLGVGFMRALSSLPLPLIRAMGAALGTLLWIVVPSRRRIALINWALYKSEHQTQEIPRPSLEIFKYFAQAWLDRSWLWHASPERLAQRISMHGELRTLYGDQPVVVFAPHFVGLDAGWCALTCPAVGAKPDTASTKAWATIYTDQSDKIVDAWILEGRQRFAPASAHARAQGVKPILSTLGKGGNLYLLPDMDFGSDGAVFAPLFGVQAATVTSLARFAKLGRAKVMSVSTRLTPNGYEVTVHPAWQNFPTGHALTDASRMNQELTRLIDLHPTQYWWLHKRFKTRPPGEMSPYDAKY